VRSKSKSEDSKNKGLTKQQDTAAPRWPVSYRWVAVGTLAIYTAIGSRTVNVAWAQGAPGGFEHTNSGSTALPARQFNIEAGPLDTVLDAFERAAAVHVTVSNVVIRSIQSPGVSGLYTPDQAMTLLLKATGVVYRFTGAQTVTLELKAASTTVDVNETASALATSSPKYGGPLVDIPQSIDVVPQAVMQQQNSTTLRDALRNVAGISLAAGEGGSQGDNLTIRGFTARNDLFIDGMRDFGSYYRDPFNVQEVEVLQGPSSMTFGRGSTGGVVNQATKAPSLNHFISGDLDIGTDLTRRVTADVNLPLPALGKNTAFRLNVMGDENKIADRDIAENRRFGVAPSLAFGLGTPTRLTLSYFHQTGDDIPDYGIPWLFNQPAPVDRNNYYGFKNGNFLRTYDDIGTIKAEHDFSPHITLRNQLRYANYVRDVQITEPQLLVAPTLATPLSAMLINRNQIAVNSDETYFGDQLDMTANFQTGPFSHSVVTGVEFGKETSAPVRPKYSHVPTTSLLDPDESQVFSGTAVPSTNVHTSATTQAGYVVDTIKFAHKFELTGGLRWDRFNSHYTQQVAPATAFNRLDEKPTWRAGLVYHPVSSGSVYVAASTSFNPSAETLALSAATANLPPETNRNVEAGSKWDLFGGRLSLRGAIFRTQKFNAREPDPNNPLLNVLAGNQRVNGLEFTVSGHLTKRWEILSSYAHLDAKVVSSRFYPLAIGAHLANVPANTFNFWTNYRLPKHWELGAGGNFVDSRTASSTVPFDPITGLVRSAPSYWVFNAMASHPITEHISIQGNIYNIANRYYYDELHPAHIVLGPGRSALIGLKFKF
jgi:catecholate siderophore receptor